MLTSAIQILLAIAFTLAGVLKVVRPKPALAANPHMGWMVSFTDAQVKLIGTAELIGGIGLILPMITGLAPLLARLAAILLATLMGGAVATHIIRREPVAVPTVLALMAAVVATAR